MFSQIDSVGRAKYINAFGKDIVVNKPGIYGENAHKQHNVASSEADDPNLFTFRRVNYKVLFEFHNSMLPRFEFFLPLTVFL